VIAETFKGFYLFTPKQETFKLMENKSFVCFLTTLIASCFEGICYRAIKELAQSEKSIIFDCRRKVSSLFGFIGNCVQIKSQGVEFEKRKFCRKQ
jgi:hypothetical protein